MGAQREENLSNLSTMGAPEQILEKRVSRLGLGGYRRVHSADRDEREKNLWQRTQPEQRYVGTEPQRVQKGRSTQHLWTVRSSHRVERGGSLGHIIEDLKCYD